MRMNWRIAMTTSHLLSQNTFLLSLMFPQSSSLSVPFLMTHSLSLTFPLNSPSPPISLNPPLVPPLTVPFLMTHSLSLSLNFPSPISPQQLTPSLPLIPPLTTHSLSSSRSPSHNSLFSLPLVPPLITHLPSHTTGPRWRT